MPEQGLLDRLVPQVVVGGVDDSLDGCRVDVDAQITQPLVGLGVGGLEEVMGILRHVMADDLAEDGLEGAKLKGKGGPSTGRP